MEHTQEYPAATRLPDTYLADDQASHLIDFTQQILDQLLGFVMQHIQRAEGQDAISYAGPGGSHIRHIVEHYEALINRTEVIDYDARARDLLLETNADEAVRRIQILKDKLSVQLIGELDEVVQVQTKIGLNGEGSFTSTSTIARELIFLASHSIHHCAILKPYCEAHDIQMDPYFGIAPSTVAHQLQTQQQAQSN